MPLQGAWSCAAHQATSAASYQPPTTARAPPRPGRHRTAAHRRALDVDFGVEWRLEWLDVASARRRLVLEVRRAPAASRAGSRARALAE